jgi:signal peptidase I
VQDRVLFQHVIFRETGIFTGHAGPVQDRGSIARAVNNEDFYMSSDKDAKKKSAVTRPPLKELEGELKRERYKTRYRRVLRSTVFTLITVAAVAILVATLWMPVLQIYGASMTPTLTDGDIVISRKVRNLKQGDIVAFYYNNRILVKRYIASAGDWVDIDEDGNVYVNNELLDEPYVYEKAMGECNIELPYQVPENRIFVLGDHRSVSIDSRSTSVGCVAEDQIVGELVFCVWPFKNLGIVH